MGSKEGARMYTCLGGVTERHGEPGAHGEGGVGEMRKHVGFAGLQVGQRGSYHAQAEVAPPRVPQRMVPECRPHLQQRMT